jgi:hypothetical protein
VGVRVAVDVSVALNKLIGSATKPVGVGTGGRELPHIFGREAQPERTKASRKMVRRFREFLQSAFVHR